MNAKYRKLALLIALILFLVFFIIPSASQSKKNGGNKNQITLTTQDPDLIKNLLIGDPKKPIENPKSVSLEKLLQNNDSYKKYLEAKKNDLYGRASIYESQAVGEVVKLIQEYAQKNNILCVLKREFLFKLLRTLPSFKDKNDTELEEQFDITDDIIKYENQKKEELKKAEEKLKDEAENYFFSD